MHEKVERKAIHDEYGIKELENGERIIMHDLHLELLALMDNVHSICAKLDIPYALMAGFALGIDNYGGFIP